MGKQLFSNERKKLAILLVVFFSIFVLSVASAAPIQSSSPKAPYAYITNDGSNNVSVIDTSTSTVIATVDVGSSPEGVTVTRDGTKVYVANEGSNTVSVIDTATKKVTETIDVGFCPAGIAVTPDGTKVYVTNSGDNNVSVIDIATNTLNTTNTPILVGTRPLGVAVS